MIDLIGTLHRLESWLQRPAPVRKAGTGKERQSLSGKCAEDLGQKDCVSPPCEAELTGQMQAAPQQPAPLRRITTDT